jgi:lipopolysaccharide/colanic/teichoic acid biosynthesis glycosyltransferase
MYRKFVKRIIDISIAALALLITLLILIPVCIVLYFVNGGKVFFVQTRPGWNGKPFNLVKLKTMNDSRDSHGKLLPDSQRLTSTGAFVRTLSIDELPQLINVLKGDMSLIGPRPLLERYLPLYNEFQRRRHEVRPGITGWAQVNGRNTLSWQEKFELDVWYVDHMSFWLDMKIIFLTIKKVLRREGISAANEATMKPFMGNEGSGER